MCYRSRVAQRPDATHSSITVRISAGLMIGSVRFDSGWKHMTRHVPLAAPIWNSGSSLAGGGGVPSSSAGKSLVNTYVEVYTGLRYLLGSI